MKKNIKKWIAFFCIVLLFTGISAATGQSIKNVNKVNYKININSEDIDVSKYLIMSKDNVTYVPLRFVSEMMGATVGYNQGQIFIDMSKAANQPTSQVDAQKIRDLQKRLELIEKENAELLIKLEKAEEKLKDSNVYNKLPFAMEDKYGLKIELQRVSNDLKNRSTFHVSFLNNSGLHYFYLKPELTEVFVGGKKYKTTFYTDRLMTTLPVKGSSLGDWYSSGVIEVEEFDTKGAEGYITFYYNVNNEKSYTTQTIYFKNQ